MEAAVNLIAAAGAIVGGVLAISLERKYPDTIWARQGVGTAIIAACAFVPPLIVSML